MSGTKVTKDPQALNEPKAENPGMVTSDSLAAESIQEGGSFAATSDARGVSKQPSSSTTTNTTDTSSATRLDPASDAEARQANEAWSENASLNAGRQLGKSEESGDGPTYSSAAGGVADSTNQSSGTATASTSQGGSSKPKGANLQEGGFDSDAPNASFNTDIGSKNDPGRVALGGFETDNVPVAGGAGGRQTEVTRDGQFDQLDETSA